MAKKILVGIIAVAVLVSGYVLFSRYSVEKRNSNVEIVIDMNDFQDLASEVGIPFRAMTKDLINHGATSIAVHETTLLDLKNRGSIAFMPLSDLMSGYYSTGIRVPIANTIAEKYKERINNREVNNYSVVISEDDKIHNFLKNSLEKRMNIESFKEDGSYAIVIKQKLRNLNQIGLGFMARDLEFAKTLGFTNVIPRVQNYQGVTTEEIDSKVKQLKDYKISTIVFEGDSVLGYDVNQEKDPVLLEYAAKKFRENELVSTIIEKPAEENVEKGQRGITIFSRKSGYISNKVFSVDASKIKGFSADNVVDQWSRAIAERNVRIIYIRPLYNPDKGTGMVLKDTQIAMTDISNRIRQMGLHKGTVRGLGDTYPKGYERLFIALGVCAAALLLLLEFVELKDYIIYAIFALLACGVVAVLFSTALYTRFGDLFIKMTALGAAVIFPTLAGQYLIQKFTDFSKVDEKPKASKIILSNIVVLLCAAGIAVLGGMIVASVLAESKYILKLDIFRGVKISFIAPLVLHVALFIKSIGIYSDREGNPIDIWLQLKKLFNTSVTVKYALTSILLIGVLVIIILRSGNTPAELSSGVERSFRSFLESVFVARPRSKELLAFPLLMLLVFTAIKKDKIYSFFIMLAGVVGLADIVNSFSHIRMPLSMAVLSTVYSLSIGIIIGSALIFLVNLIDEKYVNKERGEAH